MKPLNKMMCLGSLLVVIMMIQGCDMFSGGSSGTNTETSVTPSPTLEWNNFVQVGNVYEYSLPTATLSDFIDLGQVAATLDAVCIVVWETATRAYAGCRNTASDGQWPANCSTNADETVTCSGASSVNLYFMAALGPTRTITLGEAELADEIRRKTYCTAPRLDSSGSPCEVL